MKTNFSVSISFVAGALLFGLIFAHCVESDALSRDSIKYRTVTNPYDFIGVQHNIALDTIFGWLELAFENHEITNMSSQSDIREVIEGFHLAYLAKFSANSTGYEMLESAMEYGYNLNPDGTDTNLILSEALLFDGSQEFQSISEDLNSLFTYNDTNYVLFNEQINDLTFEALSLEDSVELKVMCGMLSIAKHSTDYWLERYQNWDNLFQKMSSFSGTEGGSVLPRFPGYRNYPDCPNCRRMAAADAAGAVTGGAGGAMVGGVLTLGSMTLPAWAAGAIGGGLTASTGEAWNIFMGWF